MQAVNAMMMGSAYLIKCDDELGSIEVAKHADFSIRENSPLRVDP